METGGVAPGREQRSDSRIQGGIEDGGKAVAVFCPPFKGGFTDGSKRVFNTDETKLAEFVAGPIWNSDPGLKAPGPMALVPIRANWPRRAEHKIEIGQGSGVGTDGDGCRRGHADRIDCPEGEGRSEEVRSRDRNG